MRITQSLLKIFIFAIFLNHPAILAMEKPGHATRCCGATIGNAKFRMDDWIDAYRGAWRDVELGAGNYGNIIIYHNTGFGISFSSNQKVREVQFKIFFDTVTNLIETKGNVGNVYINDIDQVAVQIGIESLATYLKNAHQTSSVRLIGISGDYFRVTLPRCDSMHLKNPERGLVEKWFSGGRNDRLVELASLSSSGLLFQTMFHDSPSLQAFRDDRLQWEQIQGDCGIYMFPDGIVCDGKPYKSFLFTLRK